MTATSNVDCKDDSNNRTCCIAWSNNNDGWLQQRNTRSCHARTNKIFMSHQGSKQWLQNDNILNTIIMSYVVLQEATTMVRMVDCNKHARLRKQQSTFFIDVDQQHWWLQRHKMPAIRLILMQQCKCWWYNNHSLLSYCKERRQWQTNAREERVWLPCNNTP